MPLQPNNLAALTLNLCGGRYFDHECCPIDDEESNNIVISARGVVDGGAQIAKTMAKTHQEAADYLRSTVNALYKLRERTTQPVIRQMFDGADVFLKSSASAIAAGYTLDGPAASLRKSASDLLGLLGLAAIIETRITQLYYTEGGVPEGTNIPIEYFTLLSEDTRVFAPFYINGTAIIIRSPREVYLALRGGPLTSRDLWHIAYTLHHELVCHIFQGARSAGHLEDAHPSCHWSEGWMDTVAFDLVENWNDAPVAWLPLRGESALGEIRRFHEQRYLDPPRMRPIDRKKRQRARDAYRELAKTLFRHSICISETEARDRARGFSLIANAHPEAGSKRLKALVTRLGLLLLTSARPEAQITAARACLAFTASQDFARLEQEIEAAGAV